MIASVSAVLVALFVSLPGMAGGLAFCGPEPAGGSAAGSDGAPFLSPLGKARQLILTGTRSGEGYFGKDGTRMIFQSEREEGNPFFQVYLLDLESGDTRRLSTGQGRATCAWLHPDGKRALFSASHEDPKWQEVQDEELARRKEGRPEKHRWVYDEYYDIYEVHLESGKLVNLTHTLGYDAEASYSPDGKKILFASNRRAYSGELSEEEKARFAKDPSSVMDLYLMDSDGGNVRRVTTADGQDGGPFFNADGSRMVWRRFAVDAPLAEIWTADADGGNQRQLTHLKAMSWAPFFHPTGDYVIFATNLHGFANFELYLVDADGKKDPVRVTSLDGFDGLPAFSPDGRHLAWTSNRTANGQGQIFLADWDDALARKLLGLSHAAGAAGGDTAPTPASVPATGPGVAAADIRAHVEVLASERMGGRPTGSPEEMEAARYVAAALERQGFKPAGDEGTFVQAFSFARAVQTGEGNHLELDGVAQEAKLDRDWRPLAFSASGEFEGPVAFGGYGIVAPPDGVQEAYDSYAGLDVKGRFVVVFRYVPENVPPERRQHLSRFASMRQKAMAARSRGAVGMVVVSGPSSKVKDPLVPLRMAGQMEGSSMPAISVSDEWGCRLLGLVPEKLAELQASCDGGEVPMQGIPAGAGRMALTVSLVQERGNGHNVLARLESGHPERPILVLGAHFDHIGTGEDLGSLAREEEKGKIHPGADDNASGVAVLLDVAEAIAADVRSGKVRLERDLVIAAWSGEELGLLGSARFADGIGKTPGPSCSGVFAYVNLDMVGRLREQFILYGLASSPDWGPLVERANIKPGLPLVVQPETYLPTDATSFYIKGVPILSAFTGAHDLYNTPRDTPDTLNYDGSEQVATFTLGLARAILTRAEPLAYTKVERKMPAREGHGGRRVYLGTVPDFSAGGVKGVKLADAAKGGPAANAGVRAGDVVVELAGKPIEGLEEYAYAMQLLKVGEPVKIVVMRDGQRLELDVIPGSRE
jgi:Tol biopolymer transport system component